MCDGHDDKATPPTGIFSETSSPSDTDAEGAAWLQDKAERSDEEPAARAPADANSPARSAFRKKVNDIPVEIEAVIGRVRVSVAELMMAEPGHRFRLDRRFGEPIDLLVNGRLIGRGEIVADRNDAAIGVRMIQLAK